MAHDVAPPRAEPTPPHLAYRGLCPIVERPGRIRTPEDVKRPKQVVLSLVISASSILCGFGIPFARL